MKIYIASSSEYCGKILEDKYTRQVYIEKGFDCQIQTIADIIDGVRMGDVVMLKSIWGYHLDSNLLISQIDLLKRKGVRLINDYRFVNWNIDKSIYLKELDSFNVVPCMFINLSSFERVDLFINEIKRITSSSIYDEFVIKPAISASGYMTYLYRKNDEDYKNLLDVYNCNVSDIIVQPFRNEIDKGELSVVILNGRVMYSFRRYPGILSLGRDLEYVSVGEIPNTIIATIDKLYIFLIISLVLCPLYVGLILFRI